MKLGFHTSDKIYRDSDGKLAVKTTFVRDGKVTPYVSIELKRLISDKNPVFSMFLVTLMSYTRWRK